MDFFIFFFSHDWSSNCTGDVHVHNNGSLDKIRLNLFDFVAFVISNLCAVVSKTVFVISHVEECIDLDESNNNAHNEESKWHCFSADVGQKSQDEGH